MVWLCVEFMSLCNENGGQVTRLQCPRPGPLTCESSGSLRFLVPKAGGQWDEDPESRQEGLVNDGDL